VSSQRRRRRLVLAAALLIGSTCALVSAAVVRADGDPASDFLVDANVFLPFSAPSAASSASLRKEVTAVYAAGLRVKVAVIAGRSDLGSIPSLFDKPTDYAAFLADELSGIFIGPLLVVMPSGYGIYDSGRSTAAEQAVLAGLPLPPSAKPTDLTDAATGAVVKLLRGGALQSQDILPPFVQALSGVVTKGVVRVSFYLADDSGRAAATLTLSHNRVAVATVELQSHATSFARPETRRIGVPTHLATQPMTFCLEAVDQTGNRSGRSCHSVRRATPLLKRS
jgi:hypothetical protein